MAKSSKRRTDGVSHLIDPCRVTRGKGFRLKHIDPGDTGDLDADFKDEAKALLQHGVEELRELQSKLYAQDRWALLIVIQALDAAGKDGLIEHVMSGVNPQGCQVTPFKAPSNEELDHDYLWRTTRHLPARGMIGIFNRSYYEEVLVVRVHPQILQAQKLPPSRVGKHVWRDRYEDITSFERYLDRNGVVVRKFFLHVSKEEQKRRFLSRIDEPSKNWKFSLGDVREREFWDDYMEAYEDMIRATATEAAPWHVVPADNKWFTRLIVSAAIVETLKELKLEYPKLEGVHQKELEAARQTLQGGKPKKRDTSVD